MKTKTVNTKGKHKETQRRTWRLGFPWLPLIAVLLAGCGANDTVLRSGKETPGQAVTQKSSFETDLESMRTAKFNYIFALRRRDGGPIDADDRSVIKLQTSGANRRVAADDGRAFLIGTNFVLPVENMTALNERFVIEDHSPPPISNANSNANK